MSEVIISLESQTKNPYRLCMYMYVSVIFHNKKEKCYFIFLSRLPPPSQIINYFDFFRRIVFVMHVDIYYI
jgi:hypothetical protein